MLRSRWRFTRSRLRNNPRTANAVGSRGERLFFCDTATVAHVTHRADDCFVCSAKPHVHNTRLTFHPLHPRLEKIAGLLRIMKVSFIAISLAGLVLGANAGAVDLTAKNFDTEVVESGKSAFVKFLAPWYV